MTAAARGISVAATERPEGTTPCPILQARRDGTRRARSGCGRLALAGSCGPPARIAACRSGACLSRPARWSWAGPRRASVWAAWARCRKRCWCASSRRARWSRSRSGSASCMRSRPAGWRWSTTATAIERCVDKSATSFRLARAGLPTPPTWVVERPTAAAAVVAREAAARPRARAEAAVRRPGQGPAAAACAAELPAGSRWPASAICSAMSARQRAGAISGCS